ncbi:MAG: hypothetical protein GY906_15715 [bacterium]|nr:hypothetical protein [bacterium]
MGVILRAVIVDGDPSYRDRLRQLLDGRDEVQVVGEFTDENEALKSMRSLRPHMILLDARASQVAAYSSGRLSSDPGGPVVVFVASDNGSTTLDDEAMKLLVRSVGCLPEDDSAAPLEESASEALQSTQKTDGPNRVWTQRLAIKDGSKIVFVRTGDIVWIEAASNYARLHTSSTTHLMRITMADLGRRLDPSRFVRIHRSTIVNLDYVREIQPMFHGEYVVILADEQRLAVSRSYRSSIKKLWM